MLAQANTWLTSFESEFSQPLVSTDPLLRKLTRSYIAGRLSESVDDLGNKTLFEWFPNGRLRSLTRQPQTGVSLTTRFDYNEFGDLVLATDPLGRSTAFEVDTLGRTVAVTDPAGAAPLPTTPATA